MARGQEEFVHVMHGHLRWESPTMPAKYTEAQAEGRSALTKYYREDLWR